MAGSLSTSDKFEIAEKIHHYAIGVTRLDRKLLKSIAGADATADYGEFYKGDWNGLVEYLIDSHSKLLFHSHAMSSIIIEGGDDRACSEAIVLGVLMSRHADNSVVEIEFRARHQDKWRRESGQWMIVERTLARDYRRITNVPAQAYEARYVVNH